MRKRGNGFAGPFSKRYLEKRMVELATAATRSRTEPLADWAVQRIRLEGVPFSFDGHEYLRALYDDGSRHVVISKAAQVGGTTYAILRSVHACRSGLNVGYYFPNRGDALDFSKSRVGPLLADNPFLAKLMQDTDSAGLKRIGDAYLYLRGMQSTAGMKSIPVDLLVFDELDETEPVAKNLARERLAHSSYKRIIELSNPSLPDYGIDEAYQASDQRHWTLRCSHCNAWTCLEKEFPAKLGQEVKIILPRPDGTFYRACPKCQGELDLSLGEWVADYPKREMHGYRISQLFSSRMDPGEILREYRTTRFPDKFYNLKIGVPYADLERRLDVASVLTLCTEALMLEKSDRPCTMGVDTGKDLHVVILREDPHDYEKHHLVHLAICQEFSELDALMERFEVERCVIDGTPETHATREFARRHAGRAFMNFFVENQRGDARWDYHAHTVLENRTDALDASRAAVREKKLILPRRDPWIELFAHHMAADVKVLVEDEETGQKRFRYVRAKPEDHFSLAFTYAWLSASDQSGAKGYLNLMQREIDAMNQR